MSQRLADLLCVIFVAIPTGLALYLWPGLPDPMPSHWNAAGEVDGWMPKSWGVAVMPLAALGTFLLMKVIPHISPRGYRMDAFGGVLAKIQLALVAFMSVVAVVVLLEASGVDTNLDTVVFAGTGLLLIVIGNYLGKVRKNFFLGIRTPWTLASDEVWSRTHRLGGRLFMLGGLAMLIAALIGLSPYITIGVVLACALYPVLHSYLLYRRLEGFRADGGG